MRTEENLSPPPKRSKKEWKWNRLLKSKYYKKKKDKFDESYKQDRNKKRNR
jgi:hypothetical protein